MQIKRLFFKISNLSFVSGAQIDMHITLATENINVRLLPLLLDDDMR